MKNLILLALIIMGATQLKAQIKATTESGNTVILYKNGTWKYYEAGMDETPKQQAPVTVTTPGATEATPSPTVTIDNSKEATSERFELFYAISPRMARFFGEEKGKARCYSTITNQKGKFLLSFEINMPVGDANRYFGPTLEDRNVILEMGDGSKIEIPVTEEIGEKWMDKWNQSYYVGAGFLSSDAVNTIATTPIVNVYVDWKKFPESYKVTDNKVLLRAVKEVL